MSVFLYSSLPQRSTPIFNTLWTGTIYLATFSPSSSSCRCWSCWSCCASTRRWRSWCRPWIWPPTPCSASSSSSPFFTWHSASSATWPSAEYFGNIRPSSRVWSRYFRWCSWTSTIIIWPTRTGSLDRYSSSSTSSCWRSSSLTYSSRFWTRTSLWWRPGICWPMTITRWSNISWLTSRSCLLWTACRLVSLFLYQCLCTWAYFSAHTHTRARITNHYPSHAQTCFQMWRKVAN